ncbi:MAG: family NAD(P)-dependent oxidoreductase [Patescibacteria group bacterium]|nr:family NAD(P)-dependent oxidoreductase [Patescibacteria group bacterium]
MKLNNTVFIVTGAGGGIGSELVLELLARGAKVAAVDLREESLAAIKERAEKYADSLSTHPTDITNRKSVEQLPGAVLSAHGQIDGVINCAGIIQPFVRVNDLDYEAIERVMNVNFYGTLHMTKAFLPHLLKRDEAYIANVSSMGGFLPVPGQSVYGASKAAVKLLTEGLYAELLETPVRVSIVFPGATNTNITKNSDVKAPTIKSANAQDLSARMLPADKAAAIILDGIEKNKPQIFTGSDSRLMNRLYRLNAVSATKFIAKQMKSLLQ